MMAKTCTKEYFAALCVTKLNYNNIFLFREYMDTQTHKDFGNFSLPPHTMYISMGNLKS